ncbi:sensor histidine kinase [Longitalea luteola]|uniref:sensor histidine kinase n=1 Tax=Longitalea luteola TaxID=2812563 RepID=UPI001A97094C|nr:histidine kinase [Longitalea luteola]
MRNLIFTLLFVISVLPVHSQELTYKQFTVKDGLPGSVVYDALQDKNGFIWFATSQGVSRFDGRTFRNFTKEEGLPDNDIIKLYLDKHNNIWFLSFMGIPAVYYNGVIKRFDECKGVIAIMEDALSADMVFLASTFEAHKTYAGYYMSPNISGKWKFTANMKENEDRIINNWPALRTASPAGINFYFSFLDQHYFSLQVKTAATNKLFRIKRDYTANMSPFGKSSFSTLTSDKKGIVFILSDTVFYADAYKMVPVSSLKALQVNHALDISSFFCENDTTLWISTRSRGLLRITNFLSRHRRVQQYFNTTFCTAVLKDNEKGYWITTQGEGVYYLPNLDFYHFSDPSHKTNQHVLSVGKGHPSKVVAGFASGDLLEIDHADLSTRAITNWSRQNNNNRVLQVWPLEQPFTFLVGADNGLYKVAPKKINRLNSSSAKAIYLAPDSGLFMGSSMGLFALTPAGGITRLMFGDRVTCLTGLKNHLYWGTLNGLYQYTQGKVSKVGQQYPELRGIINHLDVAPDSSLWISTQQGIVIMKASAVTSIKKGNGLSGNMCKQVSFDGNIAWVATDKGISRINYDRVPGGLQYNVSNITEEDGLTTNDVNQTVVAGDYVWAATAKGISYFSKNYISRSGMPPLININYISTGKKSVPVTDTIRVHHSIGKLLIELAGISYGSGKSMNYEYRLKGTDSAWNNTPNNIIEFPMLPYGTFVFEARAVDRWGVRSERPARVVVLHPPPFTKTTWFLALTYIILAAVLGAAFFFYYRRRQQKREQEYNLKRKVHELEMMALRAQMNPHFIFNCLTSIQYHILRADMRNANAYLHKFSTLIRQTLQYSTHSTISLREEIKLLSLYLELEKMRLGERIDYRLTISEDLKQDDLSMPTMIVQPFLENAIIHGIAPLENRTGILSVEIKRSGKYVEFIIEDNGPGIYASRHKQPVNNDHTSMGTSITSRRIDAINAIQKHPIICRITDKQQDGLTGSGTIIHLSFPLIHL